MILVASSLARLCRAGAFRRSGAPVAHAQLSIEIVGGAGTAIPIAIVPFDSEANWPLGITGIVGADLARSGMFRLVDTNGVVPRPVRAEDVQPAVWRARNADAVVVGSMRPLPRRPRRGALRAGRRGQADDARVDGLHRHAAAVPRHRAQDRRRHLRKAHRRRGVFSTRIAYVTKQGPRYPAARRRRRRRRSAVGRRVERAAAVAALVARRHAPRLRLVREQEARRLRAIARHRRAAARSRTFAAATARRRGRPTAAGSPSR